MLGVILGTGYLVVLFVLFFIVFLGVQAVVSTMKW